MSPTREIKAIECRCSRCGHKWLSRTAPKSCARCKSKYWNRKRERKVSQ